MTPPAEGFAPAKMNLTLHVTGQRADGYHLLDSLVVFANVGDRLWFDRASETSLTVTGRFSEGVPQDQRNLVWKAAALAGLTLKIRLEKNLPHGAGLGGGSSDAAALLRAHDADVDAISLGADVPVCMAARPQRMRGIGDQLSMLSPVPRLHVVLVNPRVHLDTRSVFRALDDKRNPQMEPVPETSDLAPFLEWLGRQRNDLEPVAIRQAPIVAEALASLQGALLARMSGSGATCFGIYGNRNDARSAAREISERHPGWWVQRAATIGQDRPQFSRATT